VIGVRAHIADAEGSAGRKLVLHLEAPGFDGRRFRIRLTPLGQALSRINGVRAMDENASIFYREDGIEWRVLIEAIAEIIQQRVIEPKPARMTAFFEAKGDQATATRGAGRNFALLVERLSCNDWRRENDALRIEGVVCGAAVSFVPSIGGLAAEADAEFERGLS